MSVSINLVRVTWTWKKWQEWSNLWYQEYNTENIDWFEDYSNNKRLVRENKWEYLQDDYYWKCKPKDYNELIKYIEEKTAWEYKEMYLRAIELVRSEKDIYFEINW